MEGQFGIPVEMIPRDAPKKVIEGFKTEFATWITGCGLRELLEHYALALDEIHKGAILILHIAGKIRRNELPKLQRAFHRIPGLPTKLRELEQRAGISPKHRTHIDTLYRARNCLSHGGGVVTPTHADDKGILRLKWRALEIFVEHPDGKGELIGRQMFGVTFTKDGEIMGRTVEREKVFKVGDKIHLSQQDLWEICYFFAMECIPSLLESTVAFAEGHGIKVNRLPEAKASKGNTASFGDVPENKRSAASPHTGLLGLLTSGLRSSWRLVAGKLGKLFGWLSGWRRNGRPEH
jgi:hypothetical protein